MRNQPPCGVEPPTRRAPQGALDSMNDCRFLVRSCSSLLAKSKSKPAKKSNATPKKQPKKRIYRRKPKAKPKRTGPKSFASGTQLFRRAGLRTQLQESRDQLRGGSCHKQHRYAFRLMWQEAPAVMRRYKFGKVGTFDPKNVHAGVCWAWPRESDK
jgi:hypothetical protein